MTRKSFLDPHDARLVEKVSAMISQLSEFEGERVADAEEAVASMMTNDLKEEDRRLRMELIRTVASSHVPDLPSEVDPEEIREAIFMAAWRGGYSAGIGEEDLFSADREAILISAAKQFGIEQAMLDEAMFADTPGERRLVFPAGERSEIARDAMCTLNRQRLRRALRTAVHLTLRIPARTGGDASYVQLLWGAKRLGLMIDAAQVGTFLSVSVSGPHALFGRTTMYWNRLCDFTLLILGHAGKDWSLKADVLLRERNRPSALRSLWLDHSLRSFFLSQKPEPSAAFRSGDEEAFLKYFTKYSRYWSLHYEGALVPLGDENHRLFMVPDFVARSSHSATEVLIEIVGFWKREYLEKKMEKIRLLGTRRLVLIVNSNLSVSREELLVLGDDHVRVFFYSNRTELKRVAETVAEELQRIGNNPRTPSTTDFNGTTEMRGASS